MSEELKACPFCGSQRKENYADAPCGDRRYWAVICEGCEAHGPPFSECSGGEKEAITAWNTRATDAENQRLRAEVEALRQDGRAVCIFTKAEALQVYSGLNDDCTIVQTLARHAAAERAIGYRLGIESARRQIRRYADGCFANGNEEGDAICGDLDGILRALSDNAEAIAQGE